MWHFGNSSAFARRTLTRQLPIVVAGREIRGIAHGSDSKLDTIPGPLMGASRAHASGRVSTSLQG